MTVLAVDDLHISYGGLTAVEAVSFSVEPGEVFVLLGANGAGKTSILRGISGLIRTDRGTVRSGAADLSALSPHQVAHHGVAHVPEGRRVFTHLTVRENLVVSYIKRPGGPTLRDALDSIFTLFPRLSERRRQYAGTLSGGEQQAVAIGRALMNGPTVLMLDEPSLGLSPLLTEQVFEQLALIRRQGISMLLVEQNVSCLDIATRGLVLANGRVALRGTERELKTSDFVQKAYFGV
jgi:branched-chain amino acid transport system ATP-binding protein